ncbi:MAG: hypothetical protein AAF211_09280, partial [Myxococcota bacterium]
CMLLALLGACAEPASGIAVGNPPSKTDAALIVTVAEGVQVLADALDLPLDAVYLEDCDGRGDLLPVRPPSAVRIDDTLALPAGLWCGLGLVPQAGATVLEGTSGEGRFRFAAPLGRILLFNDVGVELRAGEELVLELAEPDWIGANDLGVGAGEELDIGEDCLDDPLCVRMRAALSRRSGLFRDGNRDGQVDPVERERGTGAAGEDRRGS